MNKFIHFIKSATLKLTFFYVLIAMTVSMIFSYAIFSISSKEIDKGLGRQVRALKNIPLNSFNIQFPDLEQGKIDLLNESTDYLRNNLIYYNLLILILSSSAGYFLARRTLKPLEEAMEAQSRFTADASHELRTPITAMRTEIEVALRDKKFNFTMAKELLNSNLEETSKLESLSNALLKLSRYEQDVKKSFTKISVPDAIVTAYEKVESLADKKSIQMDYQLISSKQSKAPAKQSQEIKIDGDKESLVELFVILFENAIKYSPSKSKISVSVNKPDGHVLVKIIDHGIGIKACDLPHIFDRFYRADNSRCKEKIDGYGLGLSIAKNIVDLHNGTISATSKPGKGSEFVLKFKTSK